MTVAGIISEYNPFHSGHEAHFVKTRELLGGDAAIVCAMSGSFVQRGEAAILKKHARAEMALACGADLVLEIPTVWAVSSAERFAGGGVAVLKGLGLPLTLSFGSECGDLEELSRVADILADSGADRLTKLSLKAGMSYASAREAAVRALYPEGAELLRGPNNILAIEYLKAIRLQNAASITPATVKRVAVEHDGGEAGGFASASRLRELLRAGKDAGGFMPEAAHAILLRELSSGRAPADPSRLDAAALYRLRTMTREEYSSLPDATEGLWKRLMEAGRKAGSLEEFYSLVKTKRYAMSRLRRMAAAALLGITAEAQRALPPYIRVLGLGGRGAELLHEAKKSASLPIITKPAAGKLLRGEAAAVFDADRRASDILALAFPNPEERSGGSEWVTGPVIL